MPVVELAQVTKSYESKVAVRDLSLSIEAGQMFGLLGPNGAGKTSSIRMMMGITVPDSGRDRFILESHSTARTWIAWAICPRNVGSTRR